VTSNSTYSTSAQGSTWHQIGGMSSVAAELAEDKAEAVIAEKAESRNGKKNKIRKQDDFNFSRIFAARQAGYKGVVGGA